MKNGPRVANLGNNGLCDVRSKPCRNLVVSGDNFADNPELVCHFEIFKVSALSICDVYILIFAVFPRAFVCYGNDILLSKYEHMMPYNLRGIIKYQRYGSLQSTGIAVGLYLPVEPIIVWVSQFSSHDI